MVIKKLTTHCKGVKVKEEFYMETKVKAVNNFLVSTFKEINEQGHCVIEVENYNGSGMVAYIINLKDKVITEKLIYAGCDDFDIIKEITSSDIEDIINAFPDYEVADIDGDYIFDTEYSNVRLQKIEEELKKLFKCNEAEVAEWCVAKNKKEAYKFMDKFWDDGAIMKSHYVNKYLKANKGKTLDDFIENFFIEEDMEKELTVSDAGENDEPITKKVGEWLDEVDEVPSYLCHAKW